MVVISKEWVISVRLEDSSENKKRVALLMKHAHLKYSGQEGSMKTASISDFIRFLMDYYYTKEILRK